MSPHRPPPDGVATARPPAPLLTCVAHAGRPTCKTTRPHDLHAASMPAHRPTARDALMCVVRQRGPPLVTARVHL